MERGKCGERRGCFDLGQSIHPDRQVGGYLSLNLLQPIGEPQIPRTEGVDNQMNDRMGLDADSMQGAGRLSDELGRIHARYEQRFPEVCERRMAMPGVPFDKSKDGAQFFQFQVHDHRMFQ